MARAAEATALPPEGEGVAPPQLPHAAHLGGTCSVGARQSARAGDARALAQRRGTGERGAGEAKTDGEAGPAGEAGEAGEAGKAEAG